MDDLISREALIEAVNALRGVGGVYLWNPEEVLATIEKAPSAVVRCVECKHWHEETGWCNEHSHFVTSDGAFCHPFESSDWKMMDADYFCADGERKQARRLDDAKSSN